MHKETSLLPRVGVSNRPCLDIIITGRSYNIDSCPFAGKRCREPMRGMDRHSHFGCEHVEAVIPEGKTRSELFVKQQAEKLRRARQQQTARKSLSSQDPSFLRMRSPIGDTSDTNSAENRSLSSCYSRLPPCYSRLHYCHHHDEPTSRSLPFPQGNVYMHVHCQ